MELIALKPFYDRFKGRIQAGELFEEPSARTSLDLIRRGIARQYETKVITAALPVQEVSAPAPDPFQFLPTGFMPVRYEEPQELPGKVDSVLPEPDIPEPRTTDTRRRRGRPRKHPQ